ncbi:MAG: redoxin domain-containing protein [Bacteroidales bacterium]|nr:redoxin domain-containing protein [Bacteroidales bacterium]
MKKVFTLLLALAIGFGLKAQCPYTEARDFTATDVHGNEIHLFDILDAGQYVLIDFFFTTCGPCQQATPKIVESYYAFGCNQHDVFYMEIATGDSDAACLTWVETYGVEYPTISGQAGGTGICSQYGIQSYPTVILIAPNHQIVIQDLWPINNAQTVISALEAQGVEQHECGEAPVECDAPANLTALQEGSEIMLAWDAVATAESYNLYRNGELLANVGENAYTDRDLAYLTEYCYTVTSVCDGELESDQSNEACATFLAETLTFSMDTVVLEWGEMSWNTVYNYTDDNVTVTGGCDELGMIVFKIGGEFFTCQTPPFDFEVLQGESFQLGVICSDVISSKGIVPDVVTLSSNRPDAHFVVMVDDTWSVEENGQAINLYPNPANDFVTLSGESLGTVSVFNAIGQKVDEFEANGNELRIATNHYGEGVYFVKANGQTLRFVVTH